jgi:molybdenum cofactor cytidylyltransferase
MISAVVLAAGCSERMKKNKLLMKIAGKEIIIHTLEAVLSSNVDEIIVVTGYMHNEISKLLEKYPVNLIYNRSYNKGQSTSVKAGTNAVKSKAKGIMYVLGDQPLLTASTINKIIEGFYSGKENIIAAPFLKGKRGNPVIFDISLKEEIFALKGDRGARPLLDKYKNKILQVVVEDMSILQDIDYPEDILKTEKMLNNKYHNN